MFGHIPEGYYQQIKIDDEKAKLEQLRDQFAMAALTGLISRAHDFMFSDLAQKAYRFADAMFEARKEKK